MKSYLRSGFFKLLLIFVSCSAILVLITGIAIYFRKYNLVISKAIAMTSITILFFLFYGLIVILYLTFIYYLLDWIRTIRKKFKKPNVVVILKTYNVKYTGITTSISSYDKEKKLFGKIMNYFDELEVDKITSNNIDSYLVNMNQILNEISSYNLTSRNLHIFRAYLDTQLKDNTFITVVGIVFSFFSSYVLGQLKLSAVEGVSVPSIGNFLFDFSLFVGAVAIIFFRYFKDRSRMTLCQDIIDIAINEKNK